MILEHAIFPIKEGQSKEFEIAFAKARKYIEGAAGFQGLEMRPCIERADSYLLLVWWISVEAHMKGFRDRRPLSNGARCSGPYFAAPPEVHHYAAVL